MPAPSNVIPAGQGPIAYVLKMYPRFSETFIVSEILAREAAGEEVVIYSMRPPVDHRFHPELARVQAPVYPISRATSPRRFWDVVRAASAQDVRLAEGIASSLPDLLRESADDAEQAITVSALALEHGVRHFHAHFASMSTTVARLASLITGIPYSFTAHAKDIFHESVDPDDLRRKLRDAHHAITISNFNLEFLRTTYGKAVTSRLHLVYNGIDLDRFAYRPRAQMPEAPRILSVGRLVEKKGFDQLVAAAAQLLKAGRELTVTIIGEGPLRAELTQQIVDLGVQDHVRLLGPRTQEEVREALMSHDLFVAPFQVAADGNADGLPTVLLEAMAVGIPIVAGDVTAVGEVIRTGETGWLVPSNDLPALVSAMSEALDSTTDIDTITAGARARVEELFNTHEQAKNLRALSSSTMPVPADCASSTPSTPGGLS